MLRCLPNQFQTDSSGYQARRQGGTSESIVKWWDTCFFYLGAISSFALSLGVVSAPLWNSTDSRFAGMLTVLDIIHLIQHYYRTASYDTAAADVETFRLESLRGENSFQFNSLTYL
jgi:hypothetical protein